MKKAVSIVVCFILTISLTFIVGCNLLESNNDGGYSNPGTTTTATVGERNALRSAKNYLNVMAFSRQGLIEQLEFEGYTTREATYAVNNCGANWNTQAYKKAKEYLKVMPFSKSELINQLEFEGFTHEQAVYGVEQAYK